MQDLAENFYKSLTDLMNSFQVTDRDGNDLNFFRGIQKAGELIMHQTEIGKKLMFIGNGASASISSHMSTDYWKNGGMRAVAFNDSSLLTCISNDYGYKHVFEKSIEMFADAGDILMSISSSGKSENILRGVQAARSRACSVITFSGFKTDNPLRTLGDFNFYVPSDGYGPVEILHLSICHCIVDCIVEMKSEIKPV